jgi:hypothetical protein
MLNDAPHDEQRTSMRCLFGCFNTSSLMATRAQSPRTSTPLETSVERWVFQTGLVAAATSVGTTGARSAANGKHAFERVANVA